MCRTDPRKPPDRRPPGGASATRNIRITIAALAGPAGSRKTRPIACPVMEGAERSLQCHDRAPHRVRLRIHERPRPYRPEVCPGCSWSAIEEDVHRPRTRPGRSGTPRAQQSVSHLTVNKPHHVMHLPGSVAMNSHDIKKCKPAKAATLAQPASSHALSGTPRHERVGSARCPKPREGATRPQHRLPTKKAPQRALN